MKTHRPERWYLSFDMVDQEIIEKSEYLELSVISRKKYLPLSRRQLCNLCQEGVFKTAFKPGKGTKTSKWLVLKAEVLQHRLNSHLKNKVL
jgi:hypothetical protein